MSLPISVLCPCLDAADTIGRTIESFLAQTHGAKELIVLDGGSSDGTQDVVAGYDSPHIRLHSRPDRGMYDALNTGLRLYRGACVGVLNANDRYHGPNVLAALADALHRSDIAYGNLDFVRDHETRAIVRRWRSRRAPVAGFRKGWMPPHPTFYVRRRVAESVGPFNLDYPIAADYDWMLRAFQAPGATSTVLPDVLVDMMIGGVSTSGMRARLDHNVQALRSRQEWLGARAVDYAFFAKPLRKLPQLMVWF